jgi:hypothetical protein
VDQAVTGNKKRPERVTPLRYFIREFLPRHYIQADFASMLAPPNGVKHLFFGMRWLFSGMDRPAGGSGANRHSGKRA